MVEKIYNPLHLEGTKKGLLNIDDFSPYVGDSIKIWAQIEHEKLGRDIGFFGIRHAYKYSEISGIEKGIIIQDPKL